MSVLEAVINALVKVTGTAAEELNENQDFDLIENDIIDSLSIVAMLENIEQSLKCRLDISDFDGEDFTSVNTIVAAVSKKV